MRIAGNTQSGMIAAQLLAPSSVPQGPTAGAGFAARDEVTLSERARTAIDEIVRLAADKAGAGKPDQDEAAVTPAPQAADRPSTARMSAPSDVSAAPEAGSVRDSSAAHTSSFVERLRTGQDGQAKIIEGLEDTLRALKENLGFSRETIKIFEETGEFWSVQSAGKIQFDVSDYGGAEKYVAMIRDQTEGLEKIDIPGIEESLREVHASRLQILREYGLAPPVLDETA